MIVNRLRRALRLAGRMAGPAVTVLVFSVSACGGSPASSGSAVPAEFRTACGHPGAHVMVRKVPVTVSHAACDLTGVLITYRNYVGATVPRGDGGTTIGNSSGFTLTIRSGSLDVTVDATGTPGNAGDLRDLRHYCRDRRFPWDYRCWDDGVIWPGKRPTLSLDNGNGIATVTSCWDYSP